MATLPDKFLSCDWGTSSFRLRFVSSGRVAAELADADGVKKIFDSTNSYSDRVSAFETSLRSKLDALAATHNVPQRVPLIISGMASSSIGWVELPYAHAPFSLDGSGLTVTNLDWAARPDWLGPTYLVSGVATDDDIMRGEECQIIGVLSEPLLKQFRKKCLLILPGTHSKHVWIEDSKVIRFRTYMTGELFEVLATKTILRATTDVGEPIWKHRRAFLEGCAYVQEHGLPASLFQVRSRGVLRGLSSAENSAFLSGILIGAEMMETKDSPQLIAATSNLLEPYSLASNAAQWAQMDMATVNGHRQILSRLSNEV